MNVSKAVGLGEPQSVGKRALFRPPKNVESQNVQPKETIPVKKLKRAEKRFRICLDISKNSMTIIQDWRGRYRLETGNSIPMGKILDEALVLYDQRRKGDGSEQ